jgi:hypothetical protein
MVGLYSHLTLSTKKENRTLRIGLLAFLQLLSKELESHFSSLIFIHLGYIKSFSISIAIFLIGLFFIQFVLEEADGEIDGSMVEIPIEFGRRRREKCCADFLEFRSVKECLWVFFKKRWSFVRIGMIFLLLVYLLDYQVASLEAGRNLIFQERFECLNFPPIFQ